MQPFFFKFFLHTFFYEMCSHHDVDGICGCSASRWVGLCHPVVAGLRIYLILPNRCMHSHPLTAAFDADVLIR